MSLIVIVDDRVTNRNIFAKLAASIEEDVTVQTFGDPDEALDWLETQYARSRHHRLQDAADGRRGIHPPLPRVAVAAADVPVIVITVYEERELPPARAGSRRHRFPAQPGRSPGVHHPRAQSAEAAQAADAARQPRLDAGTRARKSERSRERALRDSSERLAQVIDTLPVDDQRHRLRRPHAVRQRLSDRLLRRRSGRASIGESVASIFGEEHGARIACARPHGVRDRQGRCRATKKRSSTATAQAHVFVTTKSPLRDASERVDRRADLLARHHRRASATEDHLRHLAHHDPLPICRTARCCASACAA